MRIRSSCVAAAAALTVALGGCGGTGNDGAPNSEATLTLDGPPAAVHAGIELAVRRGYPEAEGVQLEVEPPERPGDALTLLTTGRTQFAVLRLDDLAVARDRGRDLVAVMALVQDPLPGDARDAPPHPGLVLVVDRTTVQDSPDLIRAVVHALQRGYRETIADPESAVQAVLGDAPGAGRARIARGLDAVSPAFQADDGSIGTLDTRALERWGAWARRTRLVRRPIEVALLADGSFARSGVEQTAQEDG